MMSLRAWALCFQPPPCTLCLRPASQPISLFFSPPSVPTKHSLTAHTTISLLITGHIPHQFHQRLNTKNLANIISHIIYTKWKWKEIFILKCQGHNTSLKWKNLFFTKTSGKGTSEKLIDNELESSGTQREARRAFSFNPTWLRKIIVKNHRLL